MRLVHRFLFSSTRRHTISLCDWSSDVCSSDLAAQHLPSGRGPAVGGQSFVAWVKSAFGLTAPGWQVLCGAAALCSLVATVATQLLKSNNLEERVFRGQSCRAKLEALDIGLSTGQIDVPHATTAYMQCLEEAAYLESR